MLVTLDGTQICNLGEKKCLSGQNNICTKNGD